MQNSFFFYIRPNEILYWELQLTISAPIVNPFFFPYLRHWSFRGAQNCIKNRSTVKSIRQWREDQLKFLSLSLPLSLFLARLFCHSFGFIPVDSFQFSLDLILLADLTSGRGSADKQCRRGREDEKGHSVEGRGKNDAISSHLVDKRCFIFLRLKKRRRRRNMMIQGNHK